MGKFKTLVALFRRFSVAFRGLWHIHNSPRGIWQFKTILERFKTLVGDSSTFQKVFSRIEAHDTFKMVLEASGNLKQL